MILAADSTPLSALFWWIIPITALVGALLYVLWVTRFQNKYENQTKRSVGRFRKFQDSFKKPE
jgi:CHASE2 domain-containing sensor protein